MASNMTPIASGNVNASPALRRLQRDAVELAKQPIPNIVAEPVGNDLLKWAVNMVATSGAWKGVVVHLHLVFPDSYPKAPPTVELKTELSGHPNVFGDWICLDMLKDPEYYGRPYQGWSSSYTLSSILTQLCGFLLVDDKIDQMGSGNYSRSRGKLRGESATLGTRNCTCNFHTLPAGPLPGPERRRGDIFLADFVKAGTTGAGAAATASAAAGAGDQCTNAGGQAAASVPAQAGSETSSPADGSPSTPAGLAMLGTLGDQVERLDDHLLRSVLSGVDTVELHHCAAVGGRVGRLARDVLQRSQLVCFHTKLDYTEAMLGFGVARAWHHDMQTLRGLSAKSDYLSWRAFQEGARKSAWNTSFDAFLPLYLNPEHGKQALAELPNFTNALVNANCKTGRLAAPAGEANPQQLLSVLALLINSLVVEMVGGAVTSAQQQQPKLNPYDFLGSYNGAAGNAVDHEVTRAMSDAALQAFCHLHHLLLAAALQRDSKIIGVARRHVLSFLRDPRSRTKARCPDLGVLLVEYLLVTREEAPWEQFALIYLREALARQVRWAIKSEGDWFGQPGKEQTTPAGDTQDDWKRMKGHFESGKVGLRLIMLQAWFANALARPSRNATAMAELAAIKGTYDGCSGLPPSRTFESFNQHARSVMKCGSWMQFLAALRMGFSAAATEGGASPRAVFGAVLRQAVVDSYRAGYHRLPTLSLKADQADGFVSWEKTCPLGVTSHVWI